MIVVDTNIISELSKPHPDQTALLWFDHADPFELHISDVTVMELIYGAERYRIRHGSDRYYKIAWDLIEGKFHGHILNVEKEAFASAGRIRARREMGGRMMSTQDAMIAAICMQHGATLATRNTKDFQGLDLTLVNPFEGA